MSLFKELKRRNVFRVAAAYAVTAWLLVEIGATLEPALHLPEWVDSLLAFFLLLGFPAVLFFSWAYEITPDGLKREAELDPKRETRTVTSRRLDRIIVVVMALALGYFAVDKWVLRTAPEEIAEAQARAEIADETPATGAPETVINIDGRPVSSLSIAVLPFVNMSDDPQQEYFSDGLTEELLNLLAKIEDLKVAARSSSFFYKDKLDEIPLTQIATDLSVAHVLEGSVRKGGDKIRITAQLIKADDGFHLWSETWDRDLDDVFAIQDEIAAKVVDGLKIVMLGEETPHATVVNTESFQLALRGRYHFQRREPGDLEIALDYFEQAVKLDPDNAIAWVGLSPLYRWLLDPPETERALDAAQRAVALDPDNPEAHIRLSGARRQNGDLEGAGRAWERAKELAPNNPLLLSIEAGWQLLFERDPNAAAETQRRAVHADPMYLVNHINLANYLEEAWRFEESIEAANRGLDIAPGHTQLLISIARNKIWLGEPEAALEILEPLPSGRRRLVALFLAYFSTEDLEGSDKVMAEYEREYANKPEVYRGGGSSFVVDMAQMHAWRGEADRAFKKLFAWLEQGQNLGYWATYAPAFRPLHDDPRWAEFMAHWDEPADAQ